MKVHEVMTAHARCVAPDNTLVEAAGLMRSLDVGSLPICENDRLVGMLTDRDIVVRCVADGCDPETTEAREAMSDGILYVFADQTLEEASDLMEKRQIRRLAVLNRQKRLVGVISLGDIAIASNPAFSGIALRDISQPGNPDGRQRRLIRNSQPMSLQRVRSTPSRERATGRSRAGSSAGASSRGKTRGGSRSTGARTSRNTRTTRSRTGTTGSRSNRSRRTRPTASRGKRRAAAKR